MLTILNLENDTPVIFKQWQKIALKVIEDNGQSAIGTRDIWTRTMNLLGSKISRASVINFCEALRGVGLLMGEQQTGKGGIRWGYSLPDRVLFDHQVLMIVLMKLVPELSKADHMAAMRTVLEDLLNTD
jgi:hypothetical protein